MRDPYALLGIERTASDKDIKRAYRRLARDLHPDRNPAPDAEARFKELNQAHEVLSDPERRALYDRFGEASLQSGFDPDLAQRYQRRGGFTPDGMDFDVEDLLGSLFGREGGQRVRPSVRAQLALDFATSIRGGERELTLQGGRTLRVRIPPGVRDGGTLRLRGEGPGGGDVLLSLQVAPDPVFTRDGDDLHVRVQVTVGQALLGSRLDVPTPGGAVRLTIPEGSQNGRRLRLRGKGVARPRSAPGDLYVTLDVRLPDVVDDEVRRAVEVLERAYARSRVAA